MIYYGVTEHSALARANEHVRDGKAFDHMEVIAEGLTHDQVRSLECGLIRRRPKENVSKLKVTDSTEVQLAKSALIDHDRDRDLERWNPKIH